MGTYWALSVFSILLFHTDKLFSIFFFCKAKQWHCIGNDYGLFQWMHRDNFISASGAIDYSGAIAMCNVSLECKCRLDSIVEKIKYKYFTSCKKLSGNRTMKTPWRPSTVGDQVWTGLLRNRCEVYMLPSIAKQKKRKRKKGNVSKELIVK